MPGTPRANTAKGSPRDGKGEQEWFRKNVQRQRRRNQIAKASRRRNRAN